MDKVIYYEFTQREDNNSIIIKISTRGFPVEEVIEYDDNGKFTSNISSLNISSLFKEKIQSILDDNNLMIILDLLRENDIYCNNEHDIEIRVKSLQIEDGYV